MRKKFFILLALFYAVAQGAWAQIPDPTVFDDVWDGHSTSKPEYYSGWQENPAYKGYSDVVIIKKASELAYIRDHWKEYSGYGDTNKPFSSLSYLLIANLGEATGIDSLTPAPSPKGEGSDGWYTIGGRKLGGKPTKGVYINGGRKIVIAM